MKPGRNDPCPCGSRKKYKHCCSNLSQAAIPAPHAERGLPTEPTANEQNQLIALYQAGRYAELENQASLLLKRHPDSGFGWRILSAALSMQGKDAVHALQQTATLLPRDPEIHNNLGDILAKRGQLVEAEATFRKAIEIKPDYADANFNLGTVLVQMGDLQEAAAAYRRVLTIKPDYAEARYFLAQIDKARPENRDFKDLIEFEQSVRDNNIALPDDQSMYLNFALGKSFDDMGDTDQAFRHFAEGNRIKRKTLHYSPSIDTQICAEIMRIFDAPTIEKLRGAGEPSHLPIFIVGMPRSGTSLIEQIISSHPDVYGAGEVTDLLTITRRSISDINYPGSLRLLDRPQLTAWGTEYVAALRGHSPDALRITDKLPNNFMAIGLINVMLPNAKIIHVKRNPVDTCLSCFTQLFVQDNVRWSYDLSELGTYYANYARLMEHWRSVLPSSALLEVEYEELIRDPETQAQRLIEYCGLAWNNDCLEFHQNKRAVHTASMTQVRRPIYDSSMERWRRYEKHLGRLLESLGDLAPNR